MKNFLCEGDGGRFLIEAESREHATKLAEEFNVKVVKELKEERQGNVRIYV